MDYLEDVYDSTNITTNETEYLRYSPPIEVALEVVQFIVCLVGTAVDVLIIYVILRYKNMRKPVNIYIMNWLICDALFIFAEPAEYRLYALLQGLNANREVICMTAATMKIIRTLDVMLMSVIMFHWFFDKTTVLIFEQHPYGAVSVTWIFGLIEFLMLAMSCVEHNGYAVEHFDDRILAFVIIVFLLCFSKVHCLRRCANPFSSTSSVPIALISGFVLCWVVMIIQMIVYIIVPFEPLYYLGQFCIYLYPLLIFHLFYKIDPQFATCVKLLFRYSRSEDVATSMSFDVIGASEEDIT